jgi:hypothetical protein
MLLVQQYLETHTFGDLEKNHGVYASFSKSGQKFSLSYDQVEAKESDPLACQCRGLILSLSDGRPVFGMTGSNGKLDRSNIEPGSTRIIAYPMDRFFNHGQGSCAPINWSDPSLNVLEKLDGTLCILHWDPFANQWHVATRSCSEADIPLDNGLFTFRTLFEKALYHTCGISFVEYTSKLEKHITYCFELTTPVNRIVCHYPDYRITLLAARDLTSLGELDISFIDSFGAPKVQAYSYNTIDELINWVSSFNPIEKEGVVVRDSNFNRIKIKNINYVMYNKARDVLCNDRAFLTLILNEKEDDFMQFLPEVFQNRVLDLKRKLHYFQFKIMDQYYDILGQSTSKKEFALLVQQRKLWGAPLFQIFDKKCNNFKEFVIQNKSKIDSSFSHSFLDKLIQNIETNE